MREHFILKENLFPGETKYYSPRKHSGEIIFISNGCPRYVYRFTTFLQPEDVEKYINDKVLFFNRLQKHILDSILYREYIDYGWGEHGELVKHFSDLKFFPHSYNTESLHKRMKKAQLLIIDHPQTSFLEGFAMDTPMVLFWDKDVWLMRKEAEPYFELLHNCGILHYSPQEASDFVNFVLPNLDAWWNHYHVVYAKTEFRNAFAKPSDDWIGDWCKEFITKASPQKQWAKEAGIEH